VNRVNPRGEVSTGFLTLILQRWARPLAAYLPLKSLPRWVRAPLRWGSASPQQAPKQMERAIAGVSPPVIRQRIAALLAVDETATPAPVAADASGLMRGRRAAIHARYVLIPSA
jgi:hypothetical protein